MGLNFVLLFLLSTRIISEDQVPAEEISQELGNLEQEVNERQINLESELKATLYKIEDTVAITLAGIDSQSVRMGWRKGKNVYKDLQFDLDVNYYKIKETQEVPCKTINFLYDIKSDFEVYSYNCKKYLQCYLKYHDIRIKETLSDLVIEGMINILKSGHNNPVSTFFSNILIIEGPLRFKEELFAAFYEYVDSTP